MMLRALVPILIFLLATGCDRRRDAGQVVISAIGNDLSLPDTKRGERDFAARLLIDSTAQGLVRFDAAGQIEPGVAERWIVIDDGMSYIFRLREAEWSDGRPATAAGVVAALRRQLAPGSRNPLLPFLSAIDEVVEMTPEVIEVRLKRPRPDLLKLFAQPEMAVFHTRSSGGTGPFRILSASRSGVLLRPVADPAMAREETAEARPENDIRLIGERAARALARFAAGDSDLVSGGTFENWPLLGQVQTAIANRRIDPAAGLFGLAIINRSGFLADVQNRAAISAALDRESILGAFLPEWASVTQLLPEQLDSAAPATLPAWGRTPPANRLAAARRLVAIWSAKHHETVTLRIALPSGPGATILYGMIGRSLGDMGVRPQRVALNDPADLRLIDAVAPYDSARWYLATACQLCGADVQAAIEAAREAPNGAERAQRIAEADAALQADAAYIPIARPLRWSLVALRLQQWQGNSRAWHPLNRLRNDTK